MTGVLREFRDFVFRGNVLELAIAFVMGVAFTAVVQSAVNDLLMPLIATVVGQPSFADIDFTIGDATLEFGSFLESVVAFLAVAAVVYFAVVKPVNLLLARRTRGEAPADVPLPEEIQLLREIRDLLRQRG
ncbi:MAG: large conductance mechanosensitive channel protein MscL [Chloroflexota bacterium]|nr:large conductance mechanosensitive channel protein MscL [Dehalococcoidia bacterium]MDW8045862.1 large conductance mechanosensitive channel protein MscL [Chloroflexota bacterium]